MNKFVLNEEAVIFNPTSKFHNLKVRVCGISCKQIPKYTCYLVELPEDKREEWSHILMIESCLNKIPPIGIEHETKE